MFKSNPLFLFQVAAAYAYGFDNRNLDGINLLVFDFGGGTFDVSIIWVCFSTQAHHSILYNIHLILGERWRIPC